MIGRLMCLSAMEVYAGDSINIDYRAAFRLSPLRRFQVLDPMIDLVATYRPHRHAYGEQWERFLFEASNENETFPTINVTSSTQQVPGFLGIEQNNPWPYWLPDHYREFWLRYCVDPSDESMLFFNTSAANNTSSWNLNPVSTDSRYGARCCHLDRPWNLGVESPGDVNGQSMDEDSEATLTGGRLNVTHWAEAVGRRRSRIRREWFAANSDRYADLQEALGGYANTEADERPRMLMRSSNYIGGFEVVGLDGVGNQNAQGRTEQAVRLRVPRFFVPEQGSIMLFALVRFEPILEFERSRSYDAQPNYKYNAADTDIMESIDPEAVALSNFVVGASGSRFMNPFVHMRYVPNQLHHTLRELEGYPFMPQSTANSPLIDSDRYSSIFSNTSAAHWTTAGRVNVSVDRSAPSAGRGIFIGAPSNV